MPRPFVKAVALSGAVAATALFAFSANAAQVLTPKRGIVAVDTVSLPAGTTLAQGTTLYIDMEYSVTGSQTANEAGLGLKIGYDSTYFDVVVPATAVTALHTKCMIASPSDQLVSGTTREVVFGWIDTSIRTTPTAGAVGWPGTADPAAPGTANGCLNPGGIVTESGAILPLPATLFRIGLKSKAALGVGQTTNVTVNTAGNISYANAGNVDTAKIIKVNGAAAPVCNLDVDGDGIVDGTTDGLIIYRYLLNRSDALLQGGRSGTSALTGAQIRANLDPIKALLNVDGVGAAPDGTTDGLILYRMLLNRSNTLLDAAREAGSAETGASMKTYIKNTCNWPPGP